VKKKNEIITLYKYKVPRREDGEDSEPYLVKCELEVQPNRFRVLGRYRALFGYRTFVTVAPDLQGWRKTPVEAYREALNDTACRCVDAQRDVNHAHEMLQKVKEGFDFFVKTHV
jgi:hypothetical protein